MPTPLKLTPELADSIIESVKLGLFDAQNANRHGVTVVTLKSWIDRGIDEDAVEPFKSFATRYVQAAIELESKHVGTVLRAGEDYERFIESDETWEGPMGSDDYDSSDFDMPRAARKRKKQRMTIRGDWKASAWFLERRWPLRWGVTRQPEGGPKEAITLPDAPLQRRAKVQAMVNSPPPDLIKALRAAGFELVRREAKTQ